MSHGTTSHTLTTYTQGPVRRIGSGHFTCTHHPHAGIAYYHFTCTHHPDVTSPTYTPRHQASGSDSGLSHTIPLPVHGTASPTLTTHRQGLESAVLCCCAELGCANHTTHTHTETPDQRSPLGCAIVLCNAGLCGAVRLCCTVLAARCRAVLCGSVLCWAGECSAVLLC